jgi:hypothetical protein
MKTCGKFLKTSRLFACFELYPKVNCTARKRNRVQLCHKMVGPGGLAINFIFIFLKIFIATFITYYWTGLLILDHSYLVGSLTNAKIAETKALKPLKS